MHDTSSRAQLRSRYEREGSSVRRYDSDSFWDARYHQERFGAIVRRLRPALRGAKSFLDVGCGTGEYLILAAQLGVPRVVGADLSAEYCDRARHACPDAHVVEASGDALPFADNTVDVVLCSEVLEHLPDGVCRAAVSELQRVTRRRLIVTTPNRDAVVRRFARALRPQLVQRLDDEVGHINLLDVNELCSLLERENWQRRSFATIHVTPPVVGEELHFPEALSSTVARLERIANRHVANTGNTMILDLEKSATGEERR